ELGGRWGAALPVARGRSLDGMLAAARDGVLGGLLVGSVDPDDLPDPALALSVLESVGFVVSLEVRESAVTRRADVVLPVAPPVEKSGTYVDWEGRPRPYDVTLRNTGALPDIRVLHVLAGAMGVDLGVPDVAVARQEMQGLGARAYTPPPAPQVPVAPAPRARAGEAVLATWHWLLDAGRMQDGEPFLAGTAKQPRLHLSPTTAAEIGASQGAMVTVTSERGSITLPLVLADLPHRVVWLPTNSPGSAVRRDLAAASGAVVRLSLGSPA
ncbi:MAG: NADH-quinone oxidoreductase subunit G, partial [Actinomycetota bacterium]|nr:NADH-quinone oxidoreductase subunit G [Actinomycetota bacterium]